MTLYLPPDRPMGRVGRLERLAYERAERDHNNPPDGCWFDVAEADRALAFFGMLRHHKGEWAGQPVDLQPWQVFTIREVFGWKREDGTRRYRTDYEEIARKNGKSTKAAGMGLYLTLADQEPGAEVYSSATKRDQARIVFDAAKEMVRRSPELRKYVKSYRGNMSVARLGAKFEPLSAEGDTLDGLNPHGNIVDELHAHRTRLVWDVLDTAMGARRQPLTVAITTAGMYDPTSIGWEIHNYACQVLEGVFEDESFFAFIAAADEGDDWTDPEVWWKANPNLDVSVKREYLAQQIEKAKRQPTFLNTVLRLHLNLWMQQVTRWISMRDWKACPEREDEAALYGSPAYAGLDLSSKLDLTALILVVPAEGGFYDVVPRFWCPQDTAAQRSMDDRVPYDAWIRDGWIEGTPGDVIDYEFIEAEVRGLADLFDIRELAYDPWSAMQTALRLQNEGLTVVEVRQGYRDMSEPCKELERLVVSGKLRHGDHPVLSWMANNVAVMEDPAGNLKLAKDRSAEKIDGVVALAMAIGRAIVNQGSGRSVYETRGVLTL